MWWSVTRVYCYISELPCENKMNKWQNQKDTASSNRPGADTILVWLTYKGRGGTFLRKVKPQEVKMRSRSECRNWWNHRKVLDFIRMAEERHREMPYQCQVEYLVERPWWGGKKESRATTKRSLLRWPESAMACVSESKVGRRKGDRLEDCFWTGDVWPYRPLHLFGPTMQDKEHVLLV